MPPSKLLTHEDCREAVCVCCGVKTEKRQITVGQEVMVRSYAKPEYDSSVKSFPTGLCSTCRYGPVHCTMVANIRSITVV